MTQLSVLSSCDTSKPSKEPWATQCLLGAQMVFIVIELKRSHKSKPMGGKMKHTDCNSCWEGLPRATALRLSVQHVDQLIEIHLIRNNLCQSYWHAHGVVPKWKENGNICNYIYWKIYYLSIYMYIYIFEALSAYANKKHNLPVSLPPKYTHTLFPVSEQEVSEDRGDFVH